MSTEASSSDADSTRRVCELCATLLTGWDGTEPSEISVSTISGGITNALYKVHHPRLQETVIVRFYGDNTEMYINRELEIPRIRQLNRLGLGSELLATFPSGRIERFLDVHTMTPADMRSSVWSPLIAQKVADVHAADIPVGDGQPSLWPLLSQWLTLAQRVQFSDAEQSARLTHLRLDSLQTELDWMQRLCASTMSPVVYCHHDLLSGNFLVKRAVWEDPQATPTAADIHLIDFEYSCYGYRGYDIGNHFMEWAGFECEWNCLPSESQQKAFVCAYLQRLGKEAGPAEVNRMLVEAQAFTLASHAYWGIWSVLQARYSHADFDFLGYSVLRWNRYFQDKAAVEAAVKQVFATS